MNKKPVVAAKTARKTKLSRSQVEMAKSMGVPLEDAAKAILPKRGRPVGSKNKPTPFNDVPFSVDWEKLAKQLQVALSAEIKENDCLRDELMRKRTFWERLVCLGTGTV
jgi:hypothetical protein